MEQKRNEFWDRLPVWVKPILSGLRENFEGNLLIFIAKRLLVLSVIIALELWNSGMKTKKRNVYVR
jgi:hypothetical protein